MSICFDETSKYQKALKFQQSKLASNKSYLFNMDDKYKLIELVDPTWQGALPYTLIVEPGEKLLMANKISLTRLQ